MGTTEAQTTLRTLITSGLDGGMTPNDAAVSALQACEHDDLAALMLPVAELMARNIARQRTRRAEDAAFAAAEEKTGHTVTSSPSVVLSARSSLVREGFSLPDGTWVRWDTATAAQHRMRADWQRKHAAASIQDAERHEAAAQAIEAAGVTCLAEIGSAKERSTPNVASRSRKSTKSGGTMDAWTPNLGARRRQSAPATPEHQLRGKTTIPSKPTPGTSSRANEVLA